MIRVIGEVSNEMRSWRQTIRVVSKLTYRSIASKRGGRRRGIRVIYTWGRMMGKGSAIDRRHRFSVDVLKTGRRVPRPPLATTVPFDPERTSIAMMVLRLSKPAPRDRVVKRRWSPGLEKESLGCCIDVAVQREQSRLVWRSRMAEKCLW